MKTVCLNDDFEKIKHFGVKKFLVKNKVLVLLSLFLLLGILLGAILIKLADKNVIKFINVLFLSDFNERITRPLLDVFVASISSTFIFVLISFFMGLSMWGFVLVPVIPFLRGICIGLCESYLYSAHGLKGFCFHSLIFLPGIFISSIAVLLMTREAIKISNIFSSIVFSRSALSSMSANLKSYIIRSGCISIIILISAVIDLVSSLLFSKFFSF